jgi:hypothetical protein
VPGALPQCPLRGEGMALKPAEYLRLNHLKPINLRVASPAAQGVSTCMF